MQAREPIYKQTGLTAKNPWTAEAYYCLLSAICNGTVMETSDAITKVIMQQDIHSQGTLNTRGTSQSSEASVCASKSGNKNVVCWQQRLKGLCAGNSGRAMKTSMM